VDRVRLRLGAEQVPRSSLPCFRGVPEFVWDDPQLGEGIDATTPAGKLQMHNLGAIAEFERDRIRERVCAGLQRAKAQGTRLRRPPAVVPVARVQGVAVCRSTRRPAPSGYHDRR
jgi:hypothetical protein